MVWFLLNEQLYLNDRLVRALNTSPTPPTSPSSPPATPAASPPLDHSWILDSYKKWHLSDETQCRNQGRCQQEQWSWAQDQTRSMDSDDITHSLKQFLLDASDHHHSVFLDQVELTIVLYSFSDKQIIWLEYQVALFPFKGPVHPYSNSILIKPTFHARSNGIGPSVHKRVGE